MGSYFIDRFWEMNLGSEGFEVQFSRCGLGFSPFLAEHVRSSTLSRKNQGWVGSIFFTRFGFSAFFSGPVRINKIFFFGSIRVKKFFVRVHIFTKNYSLVMVKVSKNPFSGVSSCSGPRIITCVYILFSKKRPGSVRVFKNMGTAGQILG